MDPRVERNPLHEKTPFLCGLYDSESTAWRRRRTLSRLLTKVIEKIPLIRTRFAVTPRPENSILYNPPGAISIETSIDPLPYKLSSVPKPQSPKHQIRNLSFHSRSAEHPRLTFTSATSSEGSMGIKSRDLSPCQPETRRGAPHNCLSNRTHIHELMILSVLIWYSRELTRSKKR